MKNENLDKIKKFNSPIRDIDESIPWEFDPNATYSEITLDDKWLNLKPDEYHKYRSDWSNIPKNFTDIDFPLHLDIETTTYCNLKCPMCPRTQLVEQGKFNENGFITKDEFMKIIDEGTRYNLRSIKLNYLGEPLMHKDIAWQIEYAKKKGVIDVIMNSNGAALNEKNSESLLKAGIDGLFISFDAVNPKDYETQRVGATLGRTIDNLYKFVKLRNKIRPSCQVRVSMVMYDDPKWMEQYKALQVMWKGIVDAVGYSWYTERDEEISGEYEYVPGFHCAQPFHRMFLKNNGNVTICCVDDKDEVIVGNWKKEKLYNIWNGEKYKDIRNKHSSGEYNKIDMCRKCYLPVSIKQPGANQEKAAE